MQAYSKNYVCQVFFNTKSFLLLIYYSLKYDSNYRYTYMHYITHEQGIIRGKTKKYCG